MSTATGFVGLVTWNVDGRRYTHEQEFDMDAPLSGFDVDALPEEVESVEIIRIVYE